MTAQEPEHLSQEMGERMTGKRRVLVSFSGGRTSGYMAKRLKDEWGASHELLFVFANTGQEDERTLAFVDRCDREWGLGVVWVEAKVNPASGVGTTFTVVNHNSASRAGEPFEAVIAKFGIPNKAFPGCNRELKLRPIHAYARSIGWATGSYESAIGIRADEADRQNSRATEDRLIYPLVRWGVTKRQILRWWAQQPFGLDLPEHYGNCLWCWKKSLRKHLTLAAERPEVFDFPARMEALHPFSGSGEGPRRFFRQGWTTLDLKARARLPFQPFRDGHHERDKDLDLTDGCSESCDIYADAPVNRDLFGEAA
jgi:hypothetical protein